jgi:hypothetical protein
VEVVMRRNYALMVPRAWLFSVHDEKVSMFYMDDWLTMLVNWCCMFSSLANETQNL